MFETVYDNILTRANDILMGQLKQEFVQFFLILIGEK